MNLINNSIEEIQKTIEKGKFYMTLDLDDMIFHGNIFWFIDDFQNSIQDFSIGFKNNKPVFGLIDKDKWECEYELIQSKKADSQNYIVNMMFPNINEVDQRVFSDYESANQYLRNLLKYQNIKDWKPLEQVFDPKTFKIWLQKQPQWILYTEDNPEWNINLNKELQNDLLKEKQIQR